MNKIKVITAILGVSLVGLGTTSVVSDILTRTEEISLELQKSQSSIEELKSANSELVSRLEDQSSEIESLTSTNKELSESNEQLLQAISEMTKEVGIDIYNLRLP